jgi:hypothetical protein
MPFPVLLEEFFTSWSASRNISLKNHYGWRNGNSFWNKMESMHRGSPIPKKSRTQLSARKIMATVLCGLGRNLLGNYMTHETTSRDAHAAVFRNLREFIEGKQREVTISVLFLHENVYVQKPWKLIAPIIDCISEKLKHSPDYYSLLELSLSSEAANFAATQELPSILLHLKVHTVFTRALHWSLSWATSVQSVPGKAR